MDMVIRQGIFFVQCGECRAVLQFHIVAVDSHNPPRSTLHPNVGITPQVDPVAMGIRYRKNRLIMGYFRYGSLQSQIGRAKYDNVSSIEKRLSI